MPILADSPDSSTDNTNRERGSRAAGADTRRILIMPRQSINELVAAVRGEADAADFPIDEPVYRRAGREPKDPILFAGSLEASVCFVGRDLGKDEVAAGQPL